MPGGLERGAERVRFLRRSRDQQPARRFRREQKHLHFFGDVRRKFHLRLIIALIPARAAGKEPIFGILLRPSRKRNLPESQAQPDAAFFGHFRAMPQERKAGDVGAGVDADALNRLRGGAIQPFHRFNGRRDMRRFRDIGLERGRNHADAERLGQKQRVARLRPGFRQNAARMNQAHDREAVFRLFIVHRMPARQHASGFRDFFRAAAQNLRHYRGRQIGRKAADIHR